METISERKTLITKKGTEVYAQSGAEYILPDYKGDVKRILHTESRAMPSGKFLGEGEAELTGIVVFDVLYLDAENKLASVSFTSDYSARTQLGSDVTDVFAIPTVENVSVRLTGPRKMSARCVVSLSTEEDANLNCEAVGSTFEAEKGSEICRSSVNVCRVLRGTLADREYAQEIISAPGASIDDIEVVAKRADVKISSASLKSVGVVVSGEINVMALIEDANSTLTLKTARIPFEETVEVDGASDDAVATVRVTETSLECPKNPTEDGVRVSADVILDFDVSVLKNNRVQFVADAFSTSAETKNEYGEIRYTELLDAKHVTPLIEREIPKASTEAPRASDIVYMSATGSVREMKIEGSCVKIDGEVLFRGVAREPSDDGAAMYTSLKFTVPFSESVGFTSKIPPQASVQSNVLVSDATVDVDEENFYVSFGLDMGVTLNCDGETSCLVSSEITDEISHGYPHSVISVYYPEDKDTLFGVAKRFGASVAKIAADNALTEESMSASNKASSLVGVEKLIIRKM